jgi:hypothetical protein
MAWDQPSFDFLRSFSNSDVIGDKAAPVGAA